MRAALLRRGNSVAGLTRARMQEEAFRFLPKLAQFTCQQGGLGQCPVDGAEATRYRVAAKIQSCFQSEGDSALSNRFVLLAAAVAFGAGAPLFAAAPAPAAKAPAAKPAAKAAAPVTRVQLIKNLDASFKNVDANGDGALSQAELAAAESKGLQRQVASRRGQFEGEFTKLDTNKDGVLSKAEFMVAAPNAPATAPNGANVLAQLDKNKDGKISPDEYRARLLVPFDKADSNHDGTLTPTERQAATAAARRK